MLKEGEKKLTRIEWQLQLMLKAMTEQFLNREDREIETKIAGNLHQYHVSLFVSNKIIEIVVFEVESNELFAFARYDKIERGLLYSLRYDILHECIRDTILLDRMCAFGYVK